MCIRDRLYPEHKFTEAEFARKDNAAEIAVDTNFAAQSFWKDVRIRFFRKKSAVLGLVMIVIILLLAVFGPGMNPRRHLQQRQRPTHQSQPPNLRRRLQYQMRQIHP